MATIEELEARIARLETQLATALEERVGALEDIEAIKRLQRIYGYYLDALQFDAMADLFADVGASIEIGQRGRYEGKENIRAFFHNILGTGKPGLARDQIINHMQHQAVITLDPGRRTAKARCRALIQANAPAPAGEASQENAQPDAMMWAEGVYENTYVKQGDLWKIAAMWWSPTYYVLHPYQRLWFDSLPPSESLPPSAPSTPPDSALGRVFVPYHYRHPATDEEIAEVCAKPKLRI